MEKISEDIQMGYRDVAEAVIAYEGGCTFLCEIGGNDTVLMGMTVYRVLNSEKPRNMT